MFDPAITQWNKLVSIISGEMNVGASGLGTGTNITGRLPGIWTVEQSAALTSGLFPSIGVQLMEVPQEVYATHQQRLTAQFRIVLGASNTGTDDAPASLTLAMQQLITNMADGNGNGLSEVLRSSEYRVISGVWDLLSIKNIKLDWEYQGGTQTALAYAVYEVEALSILGV